jgi:hypothetical protein
LKSAARDAVLTQALGCDTTSKEPDEKLLELARAIGRMMAREDHAADMERRSRRAKKGVLD